MIYNKFNINILFRLLCFGVTAVALTYFVLVQFVPLLALFLIVVLIFEAISFVRFFNAVNRKLSYFFDAIRNEDSRLKFSENVKNKSLLGLHKSLNDVNKVISEVKIKNETNERFLKELIEHSTTGLMSIDQDGYVEVMNRQAKKYLSMVNLSNIRLLQQINPSVYNVLKTIKPGEKIILKQIIKNNPVNLSFQSSELCFGEKRYQLISL